MTTDLVSFAQNFSSTTSSMDVSKPANTIDNDIMFAHISRLAIGDPVVVPSDWILLGTNTYSTTMKWWLYYKLANSELSNYTWSWSSSVRTRIGIGSWRGGFDLADPIDDVSNDMYQADDTVLRAGSVSVSRANSALLMIGGVFSTTSRSFSPPTSPFAFIEDQDTGDSSSDFYYTFNRYNGAGIGSTGNIDATISSATAGKHAFAIALKSDIVITNSLFFGRQFF